MKHRNSGRNRAQPRQTKWRNFGREAGGGRWLARGHAVLQGDGRALHGSPSYLNLLLLLTYEKILAGASPCDTESPGPA